jgi:lipopolysaccharide export system protein LptA
VLDSNQPGRVVHGTSPTANLQFSSVGLLQHIHLERGVDFASSENATRDAVSIRSTRNWKSPIAELDFRPIGAGRLELASIHGSGGVVVTSESRRGQASPVRARMTADTMEGQFGDRSALSSLIGTGHALLDQTTENGTHQSTSGDRIEAHFEPAGPASANMTGIGGPSQIDHASVVGHVVLMRQQPAQPGASVPVALRATARRADYEGAGQWLHLTGAPHIENAEIALDADKVDIARASGDAFAHGSVKATWFGNPTSNLGAQGPAHVVANDAQLQQATGEATFRGQARLWQAADSISAPSIVLNRTRQTLVAHTDSQADPVRVVLLSTAGEGQAKAARTPTVIRVRGGDLKYSDAERKAIIQGGALGSVIAETAGAVTRSREVELLLMPVGNHAANGTGTAQVDRMTARGGVTIESQGRRGTGEELDYSGETGEYVLTGTPAVPPRMTDPARGTVTGDSLIFNSRDDSVNVEGGQRATTTKTTAPKRP